MEKNYLNFDKAGSDYQQLMTTITTKLQTSHHFWEVDDEFHALWTLGDHGDTNAFLRYAAALLMQDKEWFNPEEASVVLEELISAERV